MQQQQLQPVPAGSTRKLLINYTHIGHQVPAAAAVWCAASKSQPQKHEVWVDRFPSPALPACPAYPASPGGHRRQCGVTQRLVPPTVVALLTHWTPDPACPSDPVPARGLAGATPPVSTGQRQQQQQEQQQEERVMRSNQVQIRVTDVAWTQRSREIWV
ncbi:hypothetical protein E2C01_055689 [Portunus trituberculatus]|uniref:Uncharacterized protein n=1 Tax=Portunus trituberculatus TaxID=210409 RepID=A0A5B7GW90_PORTR|nr:hypothetical protein [Portunus trituberculatus]